MAPPQGKRGGGHLPQMLHAGSAIGYNYYGGTVLHLLSIINLLYRDSAY